MLTPKCFVCDREEQEHEVFIETEDGYICSECSGEYNGSMDFAFNNDLDNTEMDIDY
jgi:hypothetical protein